MKPINYILTGPFEKKMWFTLNVDLHHHILTFLPFRYRFLLLDIPKREDSSRLPLGSYYMCHRFLIIYYMLMDADRSIVEHTEDRALWDLLDRFPQSQYCIHVELEWKTYIKKHHTEYHETYHGYIVAGDSDKKVSSFRLRHSFVKWFARIFHMMER